MTQQTRPVYYDANYLLDYWIEEGFNKKTAYKAAKATAFLLIHKDPTNKIWWTRVYNYLVNVIKKNYEKKEKNNSAV